jgi:hypothetical protein
MSVSCCEGGGLHGHLGIIMVNDEYFAVAKDVFPAPANPGATATATSMMGVTAAQITETNRAHVEATCIYYMYHNVDLAFKKLSIDAFEDPFLNALYNEVLSYANHTSLQFITHLLTFYAMIAPTELTQNYEWINTPYNPNQPIKTLFQQIQYYRAFAIARG